MLSHLIEQLVTGQSTVKCGQGKLRFILIEARTLYTIFSTPVSPPQSSGQSAQLPFSILVLFLSGPVDKEKVF